MKKLVCDICRAGFGGHLKTIADIDYYQCSSCDSIFADREQYDAGVISRKAYDETYWAKEVVAARERCFGPGLVRVAETMFYARHPVQRFLDISCGGGLLLDAMSDLNPEFGARMVGIEPFPPPKEFCSTHPNFKVGYISDLSEKFDAGVCIEVIEHLWPSTLRELLIALATVSNKGSVYFFNSAQPSFVIENGMTYLDPIHCGHIVSYSLSGARSLFSECGFTVHALEGRDWCFLAEFGDVLPQGRQAVLDRIWNPVPENLALLRAGRFGELLYTSGFESSRLFLMSVQETLLPNPTSRWELAITKCQSLFS